MCLRKMVSSMHVHGPVAAMGVDVLKLKKWWIWEEA